MPFFLYPIIRCSPYYWIEVFYSEMYPNKNELINTFVVSGHPDGDWVEMILTAADFFTISGSPTQEPAWRTTFANLADNHWTFTKTVVVWLLDGSSFREYRDYDQGSGMNEFMRSTLEGEPLAGEPTVFATRDLSSEVTNDITYTIT